MLIPITIPKDLQRNGQYQTTSKSVFLRVPNRISRFFTKVGSPFNEKKFNQEGMPTCPRLPAEREQTGQGVRKKIKGTSSRSVLSLKGSAPQPHAWLTPIPDRFADALRGKDAGYSSEAIKSRAPGSLQQLPDSNREVQRTAPARTRECTLLGSGSTQAFTCLIFPLLGAGRPDCALRQLLSSFPSRAHRCSGRLLPPLLQQPTSNRPLGATAQAPATWR